jgi:hypothetical protein
MAQPDDVLVLSNPNPLIEGQAPQVTIGKLARNSGFKAVRHSIPMRPMDCCAPDPQTATDSMTTARLRCCSLYGVRNASD